MDLEFLPVDGKLKTSNKSCIGSLDDKELDIFIGSIDEHVQNLIKDNNEYKEWMAGIRLGG